jgi:hypothetical protein
MQQKTGKPSGLINQAQYDTRGKGIERAGMPRLFDPRKSFNSVDHGCRCYVRRFINYENPAGVLAH